MAEIKSRSFPLVLVRLTVLVTLASGCSGPEVLLDDRFRFDGQVLEISEVTGNASGLTYHRERDSLLLVVNKPPAVYEIGLHGTFRRKIELEGFLDTKAIAYLGRNRIALAEEQSAIVSIVHLDDNMTSVKGAKQTITLISGRNVRDGLEGLCYDPKDDELFVVKERNPMRIYRVRLHPGDTGHEVTEPWNFEAKARGIADLSGLEVDPGDGALWFLSDASRCLVKYTRRGEELGRIPLSAPHAGLTDALPVPQGITFDGEGNLYICCEPNLIYRFERLRS